MGGCIQQGGVGGGEVKGLEDLANIVPARDGGDDAFDVTQFSRICEASIDLLRAARCKHMIHAFTKADVITVPRRFIRDYRVRTGGRLSFTAFIVGCLAATVADHK